LSASNSQVKAHYATGISPSLARRALDIVVSTILLLLLAPLLLCLALAVKLSGPGSVLYRQVRVGQGGRPFRLIKFRSMRLGDGPEVTASGDPRITRVGALLRRTSLDELPQFWHVLLGRMTLVGPRPDTVDLASRYPQDCQWVLQHRPGITGPAQLYLRDATAIPAGVTDVEEYYLTQMVSRRVALDATFLARPTVPATVRFCLLTATDMLGLRLGRRLAAVDVGVETVGYE
jgi:lipopolysaccharide/colanic/teichoic acid biosynthesis glycosyltransferase